MPESTVSRVSESLMGRLPGDAVLRFEQQFLGYICVYPDSTIKGLTAVIYFVMGARGLSGTEF